MLSIVVLNQKEEFLRFLDNDLVSITETHKTGGLRTIKLDYKFQDPAEDKELFKLGNKIWIQGDTNLTDCLYVINTEVKQSVYKENNFELDAEEVLVELNYTPLVSHTEFTKDTFKTQTTNDELTVRVDWNSLNNWFGKYYNIGVIQDCLSTYASYIPFTGTMTRMSLLRHIEEQTGNTFVTRYEKDHLDNTIHRYLDFLNPINTSKNWQYHINYNFMGVMESHTYDADGNIVPEDKPWTVTRFTNSHIEPESLDEIVSPYDPETDEALTIYDTEDTNYTWIKEDEKVTDESTIKHYKKYTDLIAANIEFRILDKNLQQYYNGDDPLVWTSEDVGFDDADEGNWVISLIQTSNNLGVCVNETSFGVVPADTVDWDDEYVAAIKSGSLSPVDISLEDGVIPDDSYFEIYDAEYNQSLFRTQINRRIGTVHSEVLDFGFNLDEVEYNIDEADTYTAVSPVLKLNENSNDANSLTRANLTDIINRYSNLTISKGQTIPMILQKINVQAVTLEAAKTSLGEYTEGSGANQSNSTSNWWRRPYHPQDQKDENTPANSKWEFIRGTAYWKAPYTKNVGLSVETNTIQDIQYQYINGRPDTREDIGALYNPKMGTTESSDEDIFAIYNQCALYLKDHETPNVEIEVDVANLQGYTYNNYNIHDKVYIKLPDRNELITARIIETKKEAHDISKNTVKLSNYVPVNNIRTELQETIINASNTSFKYPNSKVLTVQLENLDYNVDTSTRTHYPANKLISFTLYKVNNGQTTFKATYTKVTNHQGQCSLNMKYNPGDWLMEINFGGDEEYLETSTTIKINVSGTIKTKTNNKTKTKSKTTNKTSKEVTKTTYYDKYGRSPDKKKVLAIGKKSASGDGGNAGVFYATEFVNKCPKCGKEGVLFWDIFYAGNETSNWGKVRLTGNREGGSAEGHVFCENQRCDGDWSVQGNEHGYTNTKLKVSKKRWKSSKADAYKLRKGKYVYEEATTTNSNKNIANTKNRKVIGKISSKIKNKALEIVGDKTGHEALKAICTWMDKNIHYGPGKDGYSNFKRSPELVLSSGLGNCCDQTRLILQLFDGAGLTEFYDMYYVHVPGHVYAQVKSKKTGHRVYIDPASDTYGCYGYVCRGYAHGSPSSKYPNRPFN